MSNGWKYPRQKQFEEQLRRCSAFWFQKKGYTSHSKMPYCLEKWEDWPKNIILPEVANYISECKADAEIKGDAYPLHKYLHHGLSSQAMAFNLFGAMKTRNDYQPIHSLLKNKGII